MVFPRDAFGRINDTRVKNMTWITGAEGHNHAPAVFRAGPWGTGEAEIDVIRDRRVFLLPADKVQTALTTQPSGRCTFLAFYNTFLQADLASGSADVVNAARPLRDWCRCASTNATGDVAILRSTW